ncbi:ArsR/SmtB family transcription factor [Halorussus halophilus]|uniref:ArsR/SmtB family transcription factor n=1 Tax=Halorussus halophilus TaxID=2650975 RepID=UPI001300D04A|nr:winged helix-turn-helix domain-containing protein [Halorussus halophilus]
MADLLPSSPDSSVGDDGDPRVIGVDSDDAEALLSALQSETAREILAALYEEPGTPSGLAERADTSIQNVRYHLEKLVDADLVEVADTIYSEKGREMKVYAPVSGPLVLLAGNDDESPALESALSSLLGGIGILGLSSLAVQGYFGRNGNLGEFVPSFGSGGGAAQATTTASQGSDIDYDSDTGNASGTTNSESGGPNGGPGDDGATTEEAARTTTQAAGDTTQAQATQTTEAGAETTRAAGDTTQAQATQTTQMAGDATQTTEAARTTQDAAADTTLRTVTEATQDAAADTTIASGAPEQTTQVAGDAGASAAAGLPPGLLFFAGGLVVLLSITAVLYLRSR